MRSAYSSSLAPAFALTAPTTMPFRGGVHGDELEGLG